MPEAVMERASEQLTESAHRISKAASAFADAFDDGLTLTKRAIKHSGQALEDLMDDNTQRIKRHPLETVVGTFVAGFGIGMLFGWLMKRR
jgi:ElaB/YqjD/DUF883 family membrane-anchored ribosome-binding protein